MTQGMLPWRPILGAKSENYSLSFVVLEFRNILEYCNADGRVHSGDYLAKSYKNFVNFGPITAVFTRFNCVHCTAGVDQHSG